jgi:hypothetical protein
MLHGLPVCNEGMRRECLEYRHLVAPLLSQHARDRVGGILAV